jgi:hypothetical protein
MKKILNEENKIKIHCFISSSGVPEPQLITVPVQNVLELSI